MFNKRSVCYNQKGKDEYLNSIKKSRNDRPNIILIFADDMGYGDLSCFGSTSISTPHIDGIAKDGVKLTNFYASSPVCSPSRFGCLTGRYPTRGFVSSVFFPTTTSSVRDKMLNTMSFKHGVRGLLPDEITIAAALKSSGYKTGIVGKWHLGDTSPYLPKDHGFDYFYGAKYSNDMQPYELYENDTVDLKHPFNQEVLTKKLTEKSIEFIKNSDSPFFLYYATPFPHHPVSASDSFKDTSKGGTYGDCVQELDHSVGEIIRTLKEEGKYENTLLVFTSDNGPWFEGSAGELRGRKGNYFDGGQKVPFVASFPKEIPAGKTFDMASMNIDFFPTFSHLAGIDLPRDRVIDGKNMMNILKGETDKSNHDEMLFIKGKKIYGIRNGENYKYILRSGSENSAYNMLPQGEFLFDMSIDVSEAYNKATVMPEKAQKMRKTIEEVQTQMNSNPRGWK